MSSWSQLLRNTCAKDIARQAHANLIVLQSSASVQEALHVLSSNKILSSPVLENGEFLGFLDVLDICGYILHMWRKQSFQSAFGSHESVAPFQELLNTPIKQIINFSQWNYPVLVSNRSPLKEILEALSDSQRHFQPHRVGVLNEKSQVYNLISQSDIISFAAKHRDIFASSRQGQKTLSDLKILRHPILLSLDTPASESLRVLYENRVSGVGLRDFQGHLSGNLSASDLRGIHANAFDYFNGSTLQFLCKGTDSAPRVPITCSSSATLVEVVCQMAAEHVHRLYVVDENLHALGVVTLSDVIQFLIE